jgi:septal ring factor EnvC (AmiA/AmiB activator)
VADDPLLAIADELYALPLADFTPRRDALVKEHKADKELAGRIKALRKPSIAAWVVNLFVRRDPDQVDQVLQVGAALREAQANMSADDLRALTRQRRQLTAAVTTDARRTAREEGHKVTESVAEQVEATLTAAMVDEGAAAAVRSGLLVAALAATGMDQVDAASAVAVPAAIGFTASPREAEPPPRPELHVVPDPDADEKKLAAARERVAAAEAEDASARESLTAAASDVEELEARTLQLQAEIDEVKGKLAELESALEETDDELSDAEDVRSEAEETADETARALAEARAALEKLG